MSRSRSGWWSRDECNEIMSSSTVERNYHRVDGYPLKEKLKEALSEQRANCSISGWTPPAWRSLTTSSFLGWRNSEWTGIAPFLEEDVAFSSIAQNEIGHARALYQLVAEELGDRRRDTFDRKPEEYRCSQLVEAPPRSDWAKTIARHYLYGPRTKSGSRR